MQPGLRQRPSETVGLGGVGDGLLRRPGHRVAQYSRRQVERAAITLDEVLCQRLLVFRQIHVKLEFLGINVADQQCDGKSAPNDQSAQPVCQWTAA